MAGRGCIFCIETALLLIANLRSTSTLEPASYTNSWAVHLPNTDNRRATLVAERHGMVNFGQIGSLEGYYHFKHPAHPPRMRREVVEHTARLYQDAEVMWVEQQVIRKRVKRQASSSDDTLFNDGHWKNQWYLHNPQEQYSHYDHNVVPVWKELNITGRGVSVSILDDGIQRDHPDLKANYDAKASYDYNDGDEDPMPRRTISNENRHGTRCAGEVAAVANNGNCIVGVAYGAKIGGIRMLDGDVTDVVEGSSLSYNRHHIDIYSSSWGPDDDGTTVDGPGKLAKEAFVNGITDGRGGLGSIFVWASGNGGRDADNCNCDGYTNSIYTLSISSATDTGKQPWYSEFCASTVASTFSSGSPGQKQIATTDLNSACTDHHTGTSASAPLAAGIFALALEANPKLTWRDLQHIVVRTSKSDKLISEDWAINGVGRKVSHKFGYGLLDAKDLVETAMRWPAVGEKHFCFEAPDTKPWTIPATGALKLIKNSTGCKGTDNFTRYLEHVEVVLSLSFSVRGQLIIYLTSPQGTRTTLLRKRRLDNSNQGFDKWVFMSTHTWEENPKGDWKLEIENGGRSSNTGTVTFWQLRFHGTEDKPGFGAKDCSNECKNGCDGPTAKDCHACVNYKYNGVCVKACPVNTYVKSVSKECLACHNSCAECFGPKTNQCNSCAAPTFLHEGTCVGACPKKWFSNAEKRSCEKCSSRCLLCEKEPTHCTVCKEDHQLINYGCIISCKAKEYADNDQCWACHPSCTSCKNSTAWSCIECGMTSMTRENVPQPLYLHRGMCVANCPSGFYGDKHTCSPCHASCKYCTGPSETQCTSCKGGLVKVVNGSTLCLDSCPKGYSHGISDNSCVKCSSGCTACDPDQPSNCTACDSGLFLWKRKCVPPDLCPKGTYCATNGKCEYCDPLCGSCVGNATKCISCSPYLYLHGGQCVSQCPVGTYGNNGSCAPCTGNCSNCFGGGHDQCLQCLKAFFLHKNSCVKRCPNRTFVDKASGKCEVCSITCDRCQGKTTNCVKCKDGLKKVNGLCQPICNQVGDFNAGAISMNNPSISNTPATQCCHQSCFTCSGPSKYECLRCKGVKFYNPVTKLCSSDCPANGYFEDIQSTLCTPCPSECLECHNQNTCTKCVSGLVLHGTKCVSRCPVGLYADQATQTCKTCDSSCKQCAVSSSTCMSCSQDRILDNYSCVAECPTGMFLSTEFNRCVPCDDSCDTCAGPGHTHCTSCRKPWVLFQAQCRSVCPVRYYHNPTQTQCQPCDYYCHRCSGGNGLTNCTECIAPFVLQGRVCVRTCSVGSVLDQGKRECVPCHNSCSTCLGTTQLDCLSCSDPTASLEGSVCTKWCTDGKYRDPHSLHCEKCHPSCKTCTSGEANACTSCYKGNVSDTSECLTGCPEGKYKEHGQCYMCSTPCKTCKGPSSTDCLSCRGDHVLHNFTCVNRCPPGTYRKIYSGLTECRKCHPSCATCSGKRPDECASCRVDLYKEKTTCVKQCSINYHLDENIRVCKRCDANCPNFGNLTDRSVHVMNDAPNRQNRVAHSGHFVLTAVSSGFIVLAAFAVYTCFRHRSGAGYTRVGNRRSRSEEPHDLANNNVPDVYVDDVMERQPMLDMEENEL